MKKIPKWANGNRLGKRLFKWLKKRNTRALKTKHHIFVKVAYGDFLFVHMRAKIENQAVSLYQSLEFVGIFNRHTNEFTDVSYDLRELLNIPQKMEFRFQRKCMSEIEKAVQQYALEQLETDTDWRDRYVLPVKRAKITWQYREQIHEMAAKHVLGIENLENTNGIIPAETFSFYDGNILFDNNMYLTYLQNEKKVVEKLGKYWVSELKEKAMIRQILLEEAKRNVWYLEKNQSERMNKIRRLREVLKDVHTPVIVITQEKHGGHECFHMDAKTLLSPVGKYPIDHVTGKEKNTLKKLYGSKKIWDIEEIYQVGARDVWYYKKELNEKLMAA